MTKKLTLKELHKIVKEHPYRTDRIGSHKSYADALEKLGEAFLKDLKKKYTEDTIPHYPFYSRKGGYIWAHQFWTNINAIRSQYKDVAVHLSLIESYIEMIHAYIEAGRLDFFYIDFGYTKEENSDYIWNPKHIYRVIYYPENKDWDFNKLGAEFALPIWEYRLKLHKERLEREKKKYKNTKFEHWIQYTKDHIKNSKKRIKTLKAIIRGKYK